LALQRLVTLFIPILGSRKSGEASSFWWLFAALSVAVGCLCSFTQWGIPDGRAKRVAAIDQARVLRIALEGRAGSKVSARLFALSFTPGTGLPVVMSTPR
jgi:uncharacterized membrane protein